MAVMSDTALQAAPATKARGYWATVGRRISRDKVSMVCAFVLIANHPTLIDVVILSSLYPRLCCVAKPALFRNPLVGPLLRRRMRSNLLLSSSM